MAEDQRKLYDYNSNFNLVLHREKRRGGASEPSGEPETLWGKIDPKEMGSRAARSTLADEAGASDNADKSQKKVSSKNSVIPETGSKSRKRAKAKFTSGMSLLDSLDALEGVGYQPTTSETREAYALLLNFLQSKMGDQSHEVLLSAANEVLAVIRNAELKDFDKKREVDGLVSENLSVDDFESLCALGRKFTDFDSQTSGRDTIASEMEEVAVVFDAEDEEEEDEREEYLEEEYTSEDEIDNKSEREVDTDDLDFEKEDSKILLKPSIEFGETAKPKEIDAFWIQKQLYRFYSDAIFIEELSERILEALALGSVRDCENQLVQLLDFDKLDFIKFLIKNKDVVFWCTSISKAPEAERKGLIDSIGNEGLKSKLSGIFLEPSLHEETPLMEKAPSSKLQPQQIIDLTALSFKEGSHIMTNKKCVLPEGSFKTNFEGYEEISIPAPEPVPFEEGESLIAIESMPEWSREVFKSTKSLNRVQSRVFDVAFTTDKNMLLCAPTGAGKTNVAVLTILREISKHRNQATGEIDLSSFKIVYVAPMKALVQEMVGNFSSRLTPAYGIRVAELTGDRQLSRQEIAQTQIIVTTPEKWDIITRKSTDLSYTKFVNLIIIDEVHLLHDERGPVIESIVSRTLRQVEKTGNHVRLVGLSATLPNYHDVAHFMRVERDCGLFYFDSSFRPCPLQQVYIGVSERKPLKRMQMMNEITYEKCLEEVGQNQLLVFVHSRKDTAKTAKAIRDLAVEKQTIGSFVSRDSESKVILQNEANTVNNADLKDLLPYGIAIHHAGMSRSDRTLVEELFADGHIQVLFSTATLAWGVNLPAHTVIIKGTQVYSPEKGKWTELSPQDVLQMLGRAGRPQFDTFGKGIIVTTQTELQFYLSLLNTQLPIESQLISKLADTLNAEIVSGSVGNIAEGSDWLTYSYLFIRMLKNSHVYGISAEEKTQDEYLEQRRIDLIHSAALLLEKSQMIRYDRKVGSFQSTELGKIASYYYISHNSMATYNNHLKPSMRMIELFHVFSISDEFKYIPVREEEKPELHRLLERVPIPVRESADEPSSKVNVLLQTYISRQRLDGFALMTDMVYISQSAARILRAIFEICLRRGWANLTMLSLELCKMVEHKMWNCMSPLRQFKSANADMIKKLERRAFPFDRMFDLTGEELGELVNNIKAGKTLHKLVHQVPKLDVQARVHPITRSVASVDLVIQPVFDYNTSEDIENSVHHSTGELFWIIATDGNNEKILYFEQLIIKPEFATEEHHVSFTIPLFAPLHPNYFIDIVSDRWICPHSRLPISFRQLVLPAKFPQHTELNEMDIKPFTMLEVSEYVEFFTARGWKHFNSIQSHCFSALYQSDDNVFVGAPNGSGKIVCAELAILNCWKTLEAGQKMIFVTPVDDLVQERYLDWFLRFKKLGISAGKLTGDSSADLKCLSENDLIVSNCTNWDKVSRRWKKRKHVQNVVLMIVSEGQLISSQYGPVMEIILSRTRYIGVQLDRNVRIVMLATSLGNAVDLGEWVGCNQNMIFNFHPTVRPLPLELHIQGFSIPHFATLMLSMVKPLFTAITKYCINDETNSKKQTIIFTPDRKYAFLTATDLIKKALEDGEPHKFLNVAVGEDVEKLLLPYLNVLEDHVLEEALQYGIGILHEGISVKDKLVILRLYMRGLIRVLVASRDVCYGLHDPETGQSVYAHLVVVMGTQYYNGKEHRFTDTPLAETIQMCGLACQPDDDGEDGDFARVLLMCPQQKKELYKKFLSEGLPVESHLDKSLHDHLNSEIVTRTVENKQDAVDYLTWTYFYRRLGQNPNFYNLTGVSHRQISEHLSELIESTLGDLAVSKCIQFEEDEFSVSPLNLGLIAAYYYISYITMEIFSMSLTSTTKLRGIMEIIAAAAEFDELIIRNEEDVILRKLYDHAPIKLVKTKFHDPHFKTFILLQSHFSRVELPSDLNFDMKKSILNRILSLIYACIDVLSSNGWLSPALACMELCQMIVQAMWGDRESVLKQLPHFDTNRIQKAKEYGIETIFDLIDVEDESVRDRVLEGLSESEISNIAVVANRYPNIELSFEIASQEEHSENQQKNYTSSPGEDVSLVVELQRDIEEETLTPVIAPYFPEEKEEGWWLIIGDPNSKQLLSIKKFAFNRDYRCNLDFTAPEQPGVYRYKLYLMSDSWLGCDQEYDFTITIEEGMDTED